jgi:hypothetical protein
VIFFRLNHSSARGNRNQNHPAAVGKRFHLIAHDL